MLFYSLVIQRQFLLAESGTRGYFGEFFGNRIGEMHDNEIRMKNLVSDLKVEWYHVASRDNIADKATRLTDPENLDFDSWIEGPEFLRKTLELPREINTYKTDIHVTCTGMIQISCQILSSIWPQLGQI